MTIAAKNECRFLHRWVKIGSWTDTIYRCHPIYRCKDCGTERYED